MSEESDVTLENGDRVIVCPWDETSAFRLENLVCVDKAGKLRWRARLPDNSGSDCFVGVGFEGGVLFATTWSGYRIELQSSGGEHLQSKFVK